MSLAGVIEASGISSGSFTVTRYTSPATAVDNEGIYNDKTTATFSIVASIQPLSGDDLKALDPALHSEELQLLLTKTAAVRTVKEDSHVADTIVIGADTWEFKTVESWSALGGTWWEAIIAKVVNP